MSLSKEEKEIRRIIEGNLELAGVAPNAFDIITDSAFILSSIKDPKHVMPCYITICKSNGMILLFAADAER